MVPSVATEKIPSVTSPGIDPETVRLVALCIHGNMASKNTAAVLDDELNRANCAIFF
jgi:hypothetical protein